MLPQVPLSGMFPYLHHPTLVTLPGLKQTRLSAHGTVPVLLLWNLTGPAPR